MTAADNTKPGDHVEKEPGERPVVVANVPERQGVTGHNVRYVLLLGLAGVVIAFALIWISGFAISPHYPS